jgi:NodT family efflux transporter outer membrane factor (OMF) lipoprotein
MTATIKNQLIRAIILLSISMLSTACKVVGPDYVRPEIKTPAAYKEALASTATETSTQRIDDHWWTLYGNDELNQLIGQVELQNYSLQAVEARSRQARAIADIAKAAQSPTVVAGGQNDLGILASWEIDLWGRVKRNVEASGATAEASADDLAAMKLSLQAQLAQNYFNLRVQDAEIRLLQDSTLAYERLLKVTQNQYAVGVADRSNVLQVQTQLNIAQSQIQEARASRAQLEHAIAVLIGKAPADFSIAVAPITTNIPEVPAALPADLLLRRPDIAAAERRVAAANAKIGVAEAGGYPSLDLFAGVSIRKGLLGGAKVLAPLYSDGTPQANRSQASAAYDEAVADYQQTALNSFREVEDNLATLQALSTAANNKVEGLKAARESLVIMNNQQQVGIINHHAMMMAQTSALDSEKAGLDILAKRLIASVNLIKALGGGWQSDLVEATDTTAATK